MKNKVAIISVHLLAWPLIALTQYLVTYQALRSLAPTLVEIPISPLMILTLVTMSTFYLNYFVLIPQFLLKRKYGWYIVTLISGIVLAFFFSGLYFTSAGIRPQDIAKLHPILLKVAPIVRTNGFLLLIIAIIASISLALNNRLRQSEQEKLRTQISYLKSQINPHFLFNTLNSIYATAIDVSPVTADMVEKLSVMMRYTLKDTQRDFVPLQEEVDYIENYIALQKVRWDENVQLYFFCSGDFSELSIAPMILISFIENAFKYGVNSEQDSKIKIRIETREGELHLWIRNLKVKMQTELHESSGLGIENTRKRLELIYPSKYLLNIKETNEDFIVSLHIDLK